MAAIGNIRKHYGLLVAIVGIALLAFVLGDLFKSTNGRRTTNVATVGNEKITYQDYSNRVNMTLENVKAQNGGSLSSEDNYYVHANTLEQMIREIIMKNEYKDLGIVVSDEELFDQFLGENPNQYVVQSFTNPDGSFNKELIETYIRDFQTLSPEMKLNWLNFENAIREDRLNTKYETLLKKGFYLPSKFAARINADKNDKTSAEVYAVRYNTIADSTVVVNDADNKAFYESNKNKYQTDATRSIDYVVFEINPSQADIEYSKNFVNELKNDFAQVENAANFVNANSDLPYDSTWMSRKDVPAELESVIFDNNNGVGFVYGPYRHNGYYNVAKIVAKETYSADSVMVRLAVVAHEITPSTATYQNVFAEANRFVTENTTAEEFNKAIEEQGLNKRTYPNLRTNTNHITGLSNPRQIVRWAFDKETKVGDMSSIFDLDNMYVVAVLTKSVKEGYTPAEDIAERYEFVIKKEKKGAMLAEQAKAYGSDYQKMIDELKGEKTTIDNLTFDGRGFGNFGVEDKVIGTVIGMKEGETSEPIIGGNGLYVVKVTKETPATTTDNSSIVREQRTRFNNQILNNAAYAALKDNVKIEDNSILFY